MEQELEYLLQEGKKLHIELEVSEINELLLKVLSLNHCSSNVEWKWTLLFHNLELHIILEKGDQD
jgi:hypothetical protein